MLTAVTGRGTLPPSIEGTKKPATGASDDPFLVLPEFVATITTTAPASQLIAGGAAVSLPFSVFLAIGPMQTSGITSNLSVSVKAKDGTEVIGTLSPTATTGEFPKAAWGPQSQDEPKPVPGGETVEAVSGITITAEANISEGTVAIDYHQVEIGKRHQLPFLSERAARPGRSADVQSAEALAAAAPS